MMTIVRNGFWRMMLKMIRMLFNRMLWDGW
jgi:hypothetical protein